MEGLLQTSEEFRLGACVPFDELSKRLKIIDAALCCVGRNGIKETSLEEIALEAGLARATLYRTFLGGREEMLAAAFETELARLFCAVSVDLARAKDLDSLCEAFLGSATDRLIASRPLAVLRKERPELLLGLVNLDRMNDTLAVLVDFAGPFFEQFLDFEASRRAAEFVARVVLSYVTSPEEHFSLSDREVREQILMSWVVPGVRALGDAPDLVSQSFRA